MVLFFTVFGLTNAELSTICTLVVGIVGLLIFLSMWNAPRDGYTRAKAFTASLVGEAKDLVSGAKALDKEIAKEEKEEEKIRPTED